MTTINLGFIGTGNMGGAMITGLVPSDEFRILGFDPDKNKLSELEKKCGLIPVDNAQSVVSKSDYIFYAVKPGLMESVVRQTASEISDSKCLVSIAAGIPLARINSWSGNRCPAVRIMPNTPALIGKGVFALCLDHDKIKASQKEFLTRIISGLGKTFILPEKFFDLFTALIGSGPAYVYYFMESMVEAGVLLGMERQTTLKMVKELFAGSSEMSLQSDMHIAQLREMVTSPGGTTIAGLRVLDKNRVKASIMEAVEMAMLRSIELGK
jgi:pyrroline-5-carboxylate reductase